MATTNGGFGIHGDGSSPQQSQSQLSQDGGSSNQGKQRQKLRELVRPLFQESYFTAEYCLLSTIQCNQPSKLSGLYAIPSAQSPFLWFAVLFIHTGPWSGGVFRFIIKFPDNFPDAGHNNLPTIQFTGAHPKHHPLIHSSRGTFDLKRYYRTYSRSNNHIWQLLKCARKIFYKLEVVEKATYPNKTAAELYMKSPEQFLKKTEVDVQNSKAKVYDGDLYSSDANFIRFSKEYNACDTIFNGNPNDKSSGIGLSWLSS